MSHIGQSQAVIGQKPADGVFREGRAVLQAIARDQRRISGMSGARRQRGEGVKNR